MWRWAGKVEALSKKSKKAGKKRKKGKKASTNTKKEAKLDKMADLIQRRAWR